MLHPTSYMYLNLFLLFYLVLSTILKKFAREWIEYCNAPGGLSYKKTRARFESMKKDMPGGENKKKE